MSISNRIKQGQNLFESTADVREEAQRKLEYKRTTYYLHPRAREAVSICAFEKGLDKSEVVRMAVDEFLGEEYLKRGEKRFRKLKGM